MTVIGLQFAGFSMSLQLVSFYIGLKIINCNFLQTGLTLYFFSLVN